MASSPGDVRLRVLGLEVIVRADDDTAAEVRRLFSPFLSPRPADSCHDDTTGATIVHGDDLQQLAAGVNAAALQAADCFAVHAGAVAADGAVVAFPAESGGGKSTLTAACLRAGLDYVTDEALCLSWDDAAVRPYPRPLALGPWSARAVGVEPGDPETADETLLTAADLGARVATGPLRLAHVVLLDAAAAPGVAPLARSAAVAELLRRSFTHWRRPDRAFELAHAVVAEARVWTLGRADPATDAAAIRSLLAA